uniref:VRR-NUC domain-containing protein n=3 Tax=Rhodoplanes serenus TaxID=200615 RepID=A0AAJ5NGP8_9BRAD|nr:hypothetical protein RHODPL_RHODPL_00057 [Rhodoplanes serenus]
MTARRSAMSETTMQQHVVKLLEAYGRPDIEWHHVPNGEHRAPRTAGRLKTLGTHAGVADLMLTIDGRSYAVELKTVTGRQSAAQQRWQERFERAGGLYFVARGLDQAIAVLTGIGAFRAGITIISAPDGSGVRTRLGAEAPAATRSPRAAGVPA